MVTWPRQLLHSFPSHANTVVHLLHLQAVTDVASHMATREGLIFLMASKLSAMVWVVTAHLPSEPASKIHPLNLRSCHTDTDLAMLELQDRHGAADVVQQLVSMFSSYCC